MLSFKSQRKLTPELSNIASEGKLGKRHPDAIICKRVRTLYVSLTFIKTQRLVQNIKIFSTPPKSICISSFSRGSMM